MLANTRFASTRFALMTLRAGLIASTILGGALAVVGDAQAQSPGVTETTLYAFGSAASGDANFPSGVLTLNANGSIYGASLQGGHPNLGTVYTLLPPAGGSTAWKEKLIHAFSNQNRGESPAGALVVNQAGTIFGVTENGGSDVCDSAGRHCGDIFDLTPPTSPGLPWGDTTLYQFKGKSDGDTPVGGLVADSTGALYGATFQGGGTGTNCFRVNDGAVSCGVIYRLLPPAPGTSAWKRQILYHFLGGSGDGGTPLGTLLIDANGVIYGTTSVGGGTAGPKNLGCGTVFKLEKPQHEAAEWTEVILHRFTGGSDGCTPTAGLIADANGVLYGTASGGGADGNGTAFRLVPPANGQGWQFWLLHAFRTSPDGAVPQGGLVLDSAGALYGTTTNGGTNASGCSGHGCGIVYKLTPPTPITQPWTETVLYAFTGGADGGNPMFALGAASGVLYGTVDWGPTSNTGTGAVFSLAGTGFAP